MRVAPDARAPPAPGPPVPCGAMAGHRRPSLSSGEHPQVSPCGTWQLLHALPSVESRQPPISQASVRAFLPPPPGPFFGFQEVGTDINLLAKGFPHAMAVIFPKAHQMGLVSFFYK